MLEDWGVSVVEVVRGLGEKGTGRGDVADEFDELDENEADACKGNAGPALEDVGDGVTKTVVSDPGSLAVTVATMVRIDGGRTAVTVSVASGAWVTVLVPILAATEVDEGELPSTATTE